MKMSPRDVAARAAFKVLIGGDDTWDATLERRKRLKLGGFSANQDLAFRIGDAVIAALEASA